MSRVLVSLLIHMYRAGEGRQLSCFPPSAVVEAAASMTRGAAAMLLLCRWTPPPLPLPLACSGLG